MNPDAKKKLIGAIIAAACAIAVYYGLIDQKQATSIQDQANQTLGTGSAQQQTAPQQASPPPTTAQVPSQPTATSTQPAAPAAPPPH